MVLMFTDIVSSVQHKSDMGMSKYAKYITVHDTLFRKVMADTPSGEILQDTGDGFLARFATTSTAVDAALRFQHGLNSQRQNDDDPVVRVGLHLGEVTELTEMVREGSAKIVGLAVDMAARIMGLACGGQILMTRAAFDDARQYVREHPSVDTKTADSPDSPPLKWLAHGRYLFKGYDDPLEVFEVGAEGVAPLSPPQDSEKARRALSHEEEQTLGWRPAVGLEIPAKPGWIVDRKIGEGGFGEVWLSQHCKTKEQRVFKFCFDVDRLRSFKRELTFFRLIREALGDRDDITKLIDVRLDQLPFYLESEYIESGNLAQWAQAQGGIEQVSLKTRLDLIARIAHTVASAHSLGIIHKDIKP
jgi:serine/threonine-protein kinase